METSPCSSTHTLLKVHFHINVQRSSTSIPNLLPSHLARFNWFAATNLAKNLVCCHKPGTGYPRRVWGLQPWRNTHPAGHGPGHPAPGDPSDHGNQHQLLGTSASPGLLLSWKPAVGEFPTYSLRIFHMFRVNFPHVPCE